MKYLVLVEQWRSIGGKSASPVRERHLLTYIKIKRRERQLNYSRIFILALLTAINTAATVLGLWFSSQSIANNSSIPVFGVEIPAALLGFMVVYIGVRSYIKLYRLMKILNNKELEFSWRNFRGGN